jgi:sulfur-oxidizing protein SoxX
MKNKLSLLAITLTLSIGVAHAATPFEQMMSSSFQTKGIANIDRLNQDAAQKFCSTPGNLSGGGDPKVREKIQSENMATIKQPSDGKYIGDWKNGEKIAQSGKGLTWKKLKPGEPIGGGCYNCHQINIKEISYGNIGPSLWNYGKLRGYSKDVVQYTWNRINNSKAYNVCSNMPRFAHILTENQKQDVMALLLDPESPVNK